jgi:hypothetical protein
MLIHRFHIQSALNENHIVSTYNCNLGIYCVHVIKLLVIGDLMNKHSSKSKNKYVTLVPYKGVHKSVKRFWSKKTQTLPLVN